MKALTFHGNKKIEYETIADPEILEPTDSIVKVSCCAICGSDLHVFHERETGCDHGTAMGHEFTGEVVETGAAIKNLKIGDKVMSPFTTNCGQCFYCRKGLTARCERGQLYGWRENSYGLHGGQAEYVRVPLAESSLVKYDEISDEMALLVGDVYSTGHFCAQQAEIHPNGDYVVVGCGPVGLMTILGALRLGAENVFVIDCIPERLERAAEFGAIPINFVQKNAVNFIAEETKGQMADSVMEVVGSPEAARLAFDLVQAGGIVSTVGVHTSNNFAFSPIEAYDKNLTYKIGRCPSRFYMEKLKDCFLKDESMATRIISHRLSLSEGKEGYRIFDEKIEGCMKVALRPD